MNSITQTLLAGAAFGALTTASAMADDVPPFHVTALYAGHMVDKTRIHHAGRRHVTSTIEVSTYVPASDLDKKVKLADTYLMLEDSGSFCNSVKNEKIKLPHKKTKYAKLGTSTETLSGYCSTGPTVFYGDTYKLTNPEGEGQTDRFVSILTGTIEYNGVKYKLTQKLDVSVAIGE